MRELSDLASLRSQGKSPMLPVYVTDLRGPLASNMTDVGCLVIRLRDDAAKWNWAPLAGLEVILALHAPASESARELARTIKAARPRRLRMFDWTAPAGEKLSAVMPMWGRA